MLPQHSNACYVSTVTHATTAQYHMLPQHSNAPPQRRRRRHASSGPPRSRPEKGAGDTGSIYLTSYNLCTGTTENQVKERVPRLGKRNHELDWGYTSLCWIRDVFWPAAPKVLGATTRRQNTSGLGATTRRQNTSRLQMLRHFDLQFILIFKIVIDRPASSFPNLPPKKPKEKKNE